MKDLLGFDIGGTKSAVILGGTDGSIHTRKEFKTTMPDETINNLLEQTNIILNDTNVDIKDIKAVGIACGGPLDSETGVILCPPNLPEWIDFPIVEIVTEKLGVPCFLENDANAGALAEWKFGAGKGCKNLIFLTFGTGMGAGLILNNQLYPGTNGMAGEVGHMRLENHGPVGYRKKGSFEGFCSGGGIAQLATSIVSEKLLCSETVDFCKTLEDANKLTAMDIGIAAGKGDSVALEIWETVGNYLGKGLSILVDVLNPEKILLGSIYIKSGKYIKEAMYKTLEKESLSFSLKCLSIEPAGLDTAIGDYQSIAVAMNGLNIN